MWFAFGFSLVMRCYNHDDSRSMGKMGRALAEQMGVVDKLVNAQMEAEKNFLRARMQVRAEAMQVVTEAFRKMKIDELEEQVTVLTEKFLGRNWRGRSFCFIEKFLGAGRCAYREFFG